MGNDEKVGLKPKYPGIGARIHFLRECTALTQEAFGEKVGVSGGFISLIEAEKKNPSENFLHRVAQVFGTNFEWLKAGNAKAKMRKSVQEIVISKIWIMTDSDVQEVDAFINTLLKQKKSHSQPPVNKTCCEETAIKLNSL